MGDSNGTGSRKEGQEPSFPGFGEGTPDDEDILPVDDAMLQKAEAMIAELREEYLRWAEDDLVVLGAIFHELEADVQKYDVLLPEMFRISHDIKGQGGSFGYDLMTRVGNQLCRYIEAMDGPPSIQQMTVIRTHMEAMKAIISNRLQGDGGGEGEILLAGLLSAEKEARV